MSSSSPLRIALPLLIVATSTGVIGCGHKAPPVPPALKNPARTVDLAVQQRGLGAVLSFTYPQTTVSGELLENLERIEVWRTRKPVAPPVDTAEEGESEQDVVSDEPDTEDLPAEEESDEEMEDESEAAEAEDALPEIRLEDQTAADALEFSVTAKLVETLNTAAIDQAIEGAKVVFPVDLGASSHEEWSHTFAIKTFASEKLASDYSNLITLVQRRPPPEPTDFQLSAEATGIRLSWSLSESTEEAPEAFRVYRRPAQSRIYSEPVARLAGDALEYLDRSAAFGERYIYAVTAVGHENPLVESFFGGEREIDYADRFAPDPPTNLIALAEAGRVRLLWDASEEDDVVGYVVFRRQAGAEFRRLTDDTVVGVEFNDRTVAAGATYDYRIAAVDRAGNQGEQSGSVIARVP